MTKDYEFILSRLGYTQLTVTENVGRFSAGQKVWGRYRTYQEKYEIVNEAGKVIDNLDPQHITQRRHASWNK